MTTKDARDKAKELARKVLDLPKDPVPVVSSIDWIRNLLDFSPVASVRGVSSSPFNSHFPLQVIGYLRSLFPILGWITRYSNSSLTDRALHLTFDPQTLLG